MITWFKKKTAEWLGVGKRNMEAQLAAYHKSPAEERQFHYDMTRDPLGNISRYAAVKERLQASGVPVEEVDIDIGDFERWLDSFPEMRAFYEKMDDVYIEKCLEHYLTYKYLGITKDDVLIDIASSGSPWAEILNGKGTKSYRLDMVYRKGIHGINIGADAGSTGLPAAFASVLATHCAYECFMGDADVRFVVEASRILNQKGRYCIAPLYLDEVYFNATSPYCDQKNIVIDNGAKRVWREDIYKVPFARHYSPEAFRERVYPMVPDDMEGKVYYFRNLPDVIKHYSGQRIYCFFMFYCEKNSPWGARTAKTIER